MAIPRPIRHFYEFGDFRLDADRHRLIRDGEVVPLPPKAIEALIVLVQHPGKLLEREELMQAVWSDAFVEDANLTVAISQLRKALGQTGEALEYIETIPRVGYRFVRDVRKVEGQPAPLIVEKHTRSRTVIEEEIVDDDKDEARRANEAAAIPGQFFAKPVSAKSPIALSWKVELVAALGVVVLLTASALVLHRYLTTPKIEVGTGPISSVAVLPLKNLTGDPENEYLSDGLTEGLINALSKIEGLKVISRGSVFAFKGREIDPRDVGKRLGVTTVLEGSVLRDKDSARATLRLVSAEDGRVLWAGDSAEHSLGDVFALQDELARGVTISLRPKLGGSEARQIVKRSTENPEAYQLYLKGNYFWNKRGPEAAKSIEYLRKAIELDPNSAQAYAVLAAVDAATDSIPSPEAEALIDKALQLDDTLAEAHATLAFIRMFHHWDWAFAERELDRALELNPNSAVGHHWKGVYLSIRGRLDEAKAEMHRASELDPLSLIIIADIGQLHYFAHEYDQAVDYCNRALALDPDFWVAHEYLEDIYRAKGMDQEVLNELLKLNYRASTPEEKQRVREVFARGGIRPVFIQCLNSDLSRNDNERNPVVIAKFYCRLGDNEHALYWLERALTGQRVFWAAYIKVDPIYDPLHNDARFREVVNRLGLAT